MSMSIRIRSSSTRSPAGSGSTVRHLYEEGPAEQLRSHGSNRSPGGMSTAGGWLSSPARSLIQRC